MTDKTVLQLQELKYLLKNSSKQDIGILVQAIENVKDLPVTKKVIQQSGVHEAINEVCKNRYLERYKTELHEKVKDLKKEWRLKLREQEDKVDKENEEHAKIKIDSFDKKVYEKALSRLKDPSRESAVENFFKLLFTPEVRKYLIMSKSTFDFNLRTVLEMALRLENAIFFESKKRPNYMKEIREKLMLLNSSTSLELKKHLLEEKLNPEDFAEKDVIEWEPEELKKKIQEGKEWRLRTLENDFYTLQKNTEEGDVPCPECKCKKVHQMEQIVRGSTTYGILDLCVNCKHAWTIE